MAMEESYRVIEMFCIFFLGCWIKRGLWTGRYMTDIGKYSIKYL